MPTKPFYVSLPISDESTDKEAADPLLSNSELDAAAAESPHGASRRRRSWFWISLALFAAFGLGCILGRAKILASKLQSNSTLTTEETVQVQTTSFEPEDQRFTAIAVWSGGNFREYLRQFFFSAQSNAGTMDLLFVNRKIGADDTCVDLAAHGVDTTWGGNVKIVCMELDEWRQRLTSALCHPKDGWNCSEEEQKGVLEEFTSGDDADWKVDRRNWKWRPLHGMIYRDIMAHPQRNLWAWIDLDTSLGDMSLFPLHLMTNLSVASIAVAQPQEIYMAGQLTMMNPRVGNLNRAWQRLPTLSSAQAFVKHTHGKHQVDTEERDWTYLYFNTNITDDTASNTLSYAMFPDLLADDDGKSTHLISGSDVFQLSQVLSFDAMRNIISTERSTRMDMYASSSSMSTRRSQDLIAAPESIDSQRLSQCAAQPNISDSSNCGNLGRLQLVPIRSEGMCTKGNWIPPSLRVCTDSQLVDADEWQSYRSTFLRLDGQTPGSAYLIGVPDRRPRLYERKLMKHHHWSKMWGWLKFPPFDIDKSKMMVINQHELSVFDLDTGKVLFRCQESQPASGANCQNFT